MKKKRNEIMDFFYREWYVLRNDFTVVIWKVSTAAVTSLVDVGPEVVKVSKSNLSVHTSIKMNFK